MSDKQKQIVITYTNHRNETADRLIEPISIWYGKTEWHPRDQWFLKARDVERDVRRDFAMVHIAKFHYLNTEVIEDVMEPASDAVLTKAKLYTDGGSRGNPGPSALGYVILDMEDNVVKKEGIYIGVSTNNQAEYQALKAGLEDALSLGVKDVHVYMDSLLVVNQVQGIWKMKNAELIPHYEAIKKLIPQFEHVAITHVPRAMNSIADGMVNECLDSH